ncbi:LRIG1-like protein [Mya arenaria]|uniref:LRIG1-like protein n=1 Tax=Mya arenaria TaxID=6604 RepID=A0ABY7DSY3_MYAAR|nr:lachesin-like [Mya arenaria]WAR00189.1 LRIG1-like protein [Mya arenaria]
MWMTNFLSTLVTIATLRSIHAEYYVGLPDIITPAPEFFPSPYNVTFRTGELATLSCSINNLGTKTVVWRRMGNSFPLTSGTLTVVADKRLQVAHVDFKPKWDLLIKDVKTKDAGDYECQIASKDRTVRRRITLNVVDPMVEMPEIRITEPQYVERGEQVILQCNATGEYYAPEEMDWFRNGQKLVSHSRKGIKITKQFSIPQRRFASVLEIERVSMEDDGTYVCRSSNTQITSTKVIVLNAETSHMKRGTELDNSASLQSDPNSSANPARLSALCVLVIHILAEFCVGIR